RPGRPGADQPQEPAGDHEVGTTRWSSSALLDQRVSYSGFFLPVSSSVAPTATPTASTAPPIHSTVLVASPSSTAARGSGAVVLSPVALGLRVPWQSGAVFDPVLTTTSVEDGFQVKLNSSDTGWPSVEMTCQITSYFPGAPSAAGVEMPRPSTVMQPSP